MTEDNDATVFNEGRPKRKLLCRVLGHDWFELPARRGRVTRDCTRCGRLEIVAAEGGGADE